MNATQRIAALRRQSLNALLDGDEQRCSNIAAALQREFAVATGHQCPECASRDTAHNGYDEAQCADCGHVWTIGAEAE